MAFRQLGRNAPEEHATRDAIKGIAVIDALAPFGCGSAAIVVRNHVLSVEAGESVDATFARATGLRQWASITRRRRGVAAIRDTDDLSPALVAAVTAAGYAGIAIARAGATPEAALAAMIAEADKAELFVLLSEPGSERSS
jgi:lipid-A-disaccharide synthase